MARCKGCEQGYGVNERGEHWIVKSLRNPTIAIMRCPNWRDIGEPSVAIEGAKNHLAQEALERAVAKATGGGVER